MQSEVGGSLAFLSQGLATRGLGFAPQSGCTGPTPSRSLVFRSDFAALSLASCFFRYSDFTLFNLATGHRLLNRFGGADRTHLPQLPDLAPKIPPASLA